MVTPPPLTRGFNCGNCGAAIALRALTHTQSVVCPSCAAIVDPRDPNVFVLQQAALKQRITPKVPLGSRGQWHGHPYEVVGFQRRSIEVDGERYWWEEYVLFNPYRGFRYLSEYQHHWNDIRTVRELVEVDLAHSRAEVDYGGHTFRHFQKADAKTDFVLGEFPWRVRTGDVVRVDDFIAPPLMLSSESTGDEITWSLGEYTAEATIFTAFGATDPVLPGIGVFANQPNPHRGRARAALRTFLVLATLLVAAFAWRQATAARETLLQQRYTFTPTAGDTVEPAFVTGTFRLADAGNVEMRLHADVDNTWLGLDLALINLETGEARNVAREIEFYSGTDADGRWTEGDRDARLVLSPVPAGEYYLRVDPESEPTGRQIAYTIELRRDVPPVLPYAVAFTLLLLPLVWNWAAESGFETKRMAESDYAPTPSDDAGDDEE
jgi:hypothetical protein